jgi:hypothetical protein
LLKTNGNVNTDNQIKALIDKGLQQINKGVKMRKTIFQMTTPDGTLKIVYDPIGGYGSWEVILEFKNRPDIVIKACKSEEGAKKIIAQIARLTESFVICEEASKQ